VDQFIQQVNVAMRQRHEYKQLSIIVDRIESYDAIDLPSDECLKVSLTVSQSLSMCASRLSGVVANALAFGPRGPGFASRPGYYSTRAG